jgi:hypothetical protein
MRSVRKVWRAAVLTAAALCLSGFTECYKPVKKSGLPANVRTVAVPAFQNEARRYKVESRVTEAVINEIVKRGKGLRVQSEREGADIVIDGTVKEFGFYGVLLDSRSRARIFEVRIVAAVTVRDRARNRVIYDNQNYEFRGEFEFTSDPRTFFNEEDPAVLRLSRAFAESLVATLTDGFGVNEGSE